MSSGSVKDFYNGKTLLLTGATGFIGKLILSKLMRVGNLKEILLLSRPKKGRSNKERLENILSEVLFEDMEKFDKNFSNKLRIVNGEMGLEGLGISSDDREYIKSNVQIIIHGAATVRFDEQLKKAIATNIHGTKSLLDIATEVKNLKSFVHISTAYSNCPRKDIEEKFYESPLDYRIALEIIDQFDDEALNIITKKLINPWPNTYTFTKAISEDMIRQYGDKLPIAIIRPTIIQPVIKDTFPGFADKLIGPIGLGVGVMAGLIRIIKANRSTSLDVIPADIVVNSILAIAWKTADRDDHVSIYNSSICSVRKTTVIFGLESVMNNAEQFPTTKMIWYPTINATSSDFMFRVLFFLYHYVPALFYDIVLKVQGSKIRLIDIYSKVWFQFQLLNYFINFSWTFKDARMQKLYAAMDNKDHKDFPVVITPDDCEAHCHSGVNGLRKYFFKETDADLHVARRKYKIFKILHYSLKGIIYATLLYFGQYFIYNAYSQITKLTLE